jgi:hypothetical protein
LVEGHAWQFEYPMWLALRGRHVELLESTVPGHPAAPPDSFVAIVCFDQSPPDCHGLVPAGWSVRTRPFAILATRPG